MLEHGVISPGISQLIEFIAVRADHAKRCRDPS
jgi:hypothetical protein